MPQGYSIGIRLALTVLITIAATYDDCRRYKVSNRIILAGMALVLGLYFTDVLIGNSVITYIYGFFTVFIVVFVAFKFGAIGAGDTKLLIVIGGILGLNMGILTVVFSFVFGGLIGLLEIKLRSCRQIKFAGLNKEVYSCHGFHYTIAILAALTVVTVLYSGGYVFA